MSGNADRKRVIRESLASADQLLADLEQMTALLFGLGERDARSACEHIIAARRILRGLAALRGEE